MKIGYFADGIWAHKALERIIEDPRFEISFIVPRFDNQDPVLKDKSERLKVPFIPVENVNNKEFIGEIKKLEVDVNVSMSFNQILRQEIIYLAPEGFINCHAGKLPFYRGRNILNWALINDEKEFGVTVHYVDSEIDTGDIILQNTSKITDKDDYSTLLDRAIELCAETLYQSLCLIYNNEVIRMPQKDIHPVGFYCGRRIEGDEEIDWNWSSRRIFNFVRGITTPGPCARTFINNEEVKIVKTEIINGALNYIGSPGEIVGRTGKNIIVKTGDSTILISEIIMTTKTNKIKIGGRLGNNLILERM
jgi:methionyl-tRNA formyltransferase